MPSLITGQSFDRIMRAVKTVEGAGGAGASVVPGVGMTYGEAGPLIRKPNATVSDSIDVWVTQTGGSAGDESTQCSFTYSIYPWNDPTKAGTAIATEVAVQGNGHRVLNATMTSGTLGRARQVTSGSTTTWKLLWVDEKFSQSNCAETFSESGPTLEVYATGTAYSLTNTSALLNFGTQDPTITVEEAGTYIVHAMVNLKYNGATFAANRNVTVKVRRTNNSAADLISTVVTTGIVTTTTGTFLLVELPEFYYTTTNTDDVLEIWADVATVPSAGSLDAVEASILLERVA